jgi:hypothetical protein
MQYSGLYVCCVTGICTAFICYSDKCLMFVIGHCLFIGAVVCSFLVKTSKHSGYCMYCQVFMCFVCLTIKTDYLHKHH